MKPAIAVIAVAIAGPADAHCYSVWNYPTPQHCGGLYARRHIPPPSALAALPPIRDAALKAADDPPPETPAPEIAPTPAREVWPSLQQWDEELAAERDLALARLREELRAR